MFLKESATQRPQIEETSFFVLNRQAKSNGCPKSAFPADDNQVIASWPGVATLAVTTDTGCRRRGQCGRLPVNGFDLSWLPPVSLGSEVLLLRPARLCLPGTVTSLLPSVSLSLCLPFETL